MCNAWNHPPGCTCGWGGEGHLGGGGYNNSPGSDLFAKSVHQFRHLYETYVNPNARCPVCGKAVYFYQSPYGGRVFFDDLGPPWPKHPCTSDEYSPLTFISGERTRPKWLTHRWIPARLPEMGYKGKHLIAFLLLYPDKVMVVEAYIYSAEAMHFIKNADFLFCKLTDEESIEITAYNVFPEETKIFILRQRRKNKPI